MGKMWAPGRKPVLVGPVVSASSTLSKRTHGIPPLLDSVTKTALRADIAAHLLENGSGHWRELRKRYPQVAEATFWRYVARMKAAQRTTAADNSPDPSENNAAPNFEAAPDLMRPSCRATLRAEEMRIELASLFADAERLRQYAVDQHEEIRRPQAFMASIDARAKVLAGAVRLVREIDTIEKRQRFYDAIVDIVLEHVPKSEHLVVIEKLERLNAAQTVQTDFQ